MEELSSGVLVKFLQEIDIDGSTLRDHKPVLLQIRSIIPVLRGGDLFPNQGFFLKVSDLSHALYVSLPQEQDEMVLYDKLHLGQLIYVDKLEAAYPVPMLKGVRPLRGRQPCYGNPKDLLPMHNLEKVIGMCNIIESKPEEDDPDVVEKRPIEKSQSLSGDFGLKSNLSENNTSTKGELGWTNQEEISEVTNKKPSEKCRSRSNEGINRIPLHYKPKKIVSESASRPRRRSAEIGKGVQKNRSRSMDESSDVESTVSGISRASRSTKSQWKGRHIPRTTDTIDNSIIKRELKPSGDSTAHPSYPILLSRNNSSDGSSSSKIKRIVNNISTKLPKNHHKVISVPKEITEDTDHDEKTTSNATHENNFSNTNISWNFLPQMLVKLGQEVLRRRDVALEAAVEALLEASASEELLKCLSSYSELFSTKKNDQHPSVDKFFRLENDMAHARLIIQSLTSNASLSICDTDQSCLHLSKEALQLATDRKRNAISWIKASLASDVNSDLDCTKVKGIDPLTTNTDDGSTRKYRNRRNNESNVEFRTGNDDQPGWVKGNIMLVSTELENSLRKESTRWFLSHVEDYLDWVSSKTTSSESDSEVAEMMFQIKRVNDWLDVKCKDVSSFEESEVESYGRLRNKLYGILLKHAERTALHAIVELH